MSSAASCSSERRGVAVVVDAVERDVPCHAQDARVLELLQLVERRVVRDDRDTLVAPIAPRDRVEQAGVVEAVAGVRPDQQRVARAVGLHHLRELRRRAHLLAQRTVVRVRAVRKARRIEDVHVAVDLRLVEDPDIHRALDGR